MNFENYRLEQGKIVIAYSDEKISLGYLDIDPGKALSKHNRPCIESLYQIKGTCTMFLFDENDSPKEFVLNEGDQLEIPLGQFHIHSNKGSENSITMWKALGDIRQILDNIRKESKL